MNAIADSTGFSHRVLTHTRIRYLEDDSQSIGAGNDDLPVVYAMNDQLLVSESVRAQVHHTLEGLRMDWAVLSTLFDGLILPDGRKPETVEVYGLHSPDHDLDIFQVTRELRAALPRDDRNKVSPNHVLIPAPEWHGCPSGPPKPLPPGVAKPGNGQLGQPGPGPMVAVTVIDSGYLWSAWWNRRVAWAGGPIGPHGHVAQQIVQTNPLDVRGHQTVIGATTPWPILNAPTSITALEGHANFVAGIVAMSCPNAEITIRTFNGGFPPDSDDIPTEAMLLPALVDSVFVDGAQVINFGFSYVPFGGIPHQAWGDVLELIGSDRIMTAPAGNQQSPFPHYPAALPVPNVLGVASIEHGLAGLQLSGDFSNHGSWVKCSAIGKDVVSTFLLADVSCEDDPAMPPSRQSFDAWAVWNGTSFAAPKVAGAIAQAVVAGGGAMTAYAAWDQVVRPTGVEDPAHDLGVQFDF